MRIWHTASLALFWLILSESFTVERIILGIIIACIVAKFNEDLATGSDKGIGFNINKIIIFVKYLSLLIIEIFKSNINVAKIVLNPKMNISPCVYKIHTNLKSNLLKTVLANSITLTPGTLTLFMDGDEMIIHSLKEENIKDLEDSSFEKILLKAEEI